MELTPTQKETILKLKSIFKYENSHISENDFIIKIEDDKRFISLTLEIQNDYYNRLFALIGKRGKILHLHCNGLEYEGKDIDTYMYRLRYTDYNPCKIKIKSKPIPSYYGIQMYKMDYPKDSGLKSIGINNNKTTKKFFDKYYPDYGGISVDYIHMPDGGDGVLDIPLPDKTERIHFGYYPTYYGEGEIYTTKVSIDNNYSDDGGYPMNYEEKIKTRLTNRQVVAKVFKIWLKHNNFL